MKTLNSTLSAERECTHLLSIPTDKRSSAAALAPSVVRLPSSFSSPVLRSTAANLSRGNLLHQPSEDTCTPHSLPQFQPASGDLRSLPLLKKTRGELSSPERRNFPPASSATQAESLPSTRLLSQCARVRLVFLKQGERKPTLAQPHIALGKHQTKSVHVPDEDRTSFPVLFLPTTDACYTHYGTGVGPICLLSRMSLRKRRGGASQFRHER